MDTSVDTKKDTPKSSAAPAVIIVLIVIIGIFILSAVFGSQGSATQSAQSSTTDQTQQNQVEAQSTPNRIPTEDISVDGIILAPAGVDYNLIGTMTNNSPYPINNIDVTVEAYDCPTYSIEPSCSHIGEDTNVDMFIQNNLYGQIPPGQTREMEGAVYLNGMPPINGHFVWTYTITGAHQFSP